MTRLSAGRLLQRAAPGAPGTAASRAQHGKPNCIQTSLYWGRNANHLVAVWNIACLTELNSNERCSVLSLHRPSGCLRGVGRGIAPGVQAQKRSIINYWTDVTILPASSYYLTASRWWLSWICLWYAINLCHWTILDPWNVCMLYMYQKFKPVPFDGTPGRCIRSGPASVCCHRQWGKQGISGPRQDVCHILLQGGF